VGWPIGKELLFSARVVEAEEAYRIGLLNYLVPREQLRAKTMELSLSSRGVLVKIRGRGDCSHAVLVALRHCAAASDRKIRSVGRETRWRWRLKVLWTAA
jgi:enoyl-CoA hydratase/carnithine racemase